MDRNDDRHLNEDLLAVAVIDKFDLPTDSRRHLDTCPECRNAVARFEQHLKHIGRMAEAFTPPPARPVRLPLPSTSASPKQWFQFSRWAGAAVAALMVITLIWWYSDGGIHPELYAPRPTAEPWEDQQLMTEISMLSENALPQAFIDISEAPASEVDEEFYEFIIPLPDNDSLSLDQGTQGGLPC